MAGCPCCGIEDGHGDWCRVGELEAEITNAHARGYRDHALAVQPEIAELKEENADYQTMFGFIGLELRPEGGLKYGEIKAEIAELKKRVVRALTICQPACLSRIPSEDEARKYVRGQEARIAELEEQLAAATDPTRVPKSVHDRVVAQLKEEVSANTKLAVHWMGKAEALLDTMDRKSDE